jgi:hypothetical protein
VTTFTEFLAARLTEDEDDATELWLLDPLHCPVCGVLVKEYVTPAELFGRKPNRLDRCEPCGHEVADEMISACFREVIPVRVKADLVAKRAIMAEHVPLPCMNERHQGGLHCAVCEYDVISRGWHPCPTLRFLGAIYSDHPDYQQEWAP